MPEIYYSDKYYDEEHEYRHVVLPKEMVKLVPKNHLMSEQEWRGIGVQQSHGWVHYMTHQPAVMLISPEGKIFILVLVLPFGIPLLGWMGLPSYEEDIVYYTTLARQSPIFYFSEEKRPHQ